MHIVHIIVLADYESVSEEIRLKVFNDTLKRTFLSYSNIYYFIITFLVVNRFVFLVEP